MIAPTKEKATVKALSINDDVNQNVVFAGDQATISLSGVEMANISIGYLLSDIQNPIPITCRFQANIIVFNIPIPIINGCSVVLHHQALVEPAIIKKVISIVHKVSSWKS